MCSRPDIVPRSFQDKVEIIRNRPLEITFCEWFDEKSDIWSDKMHNHPQVIEMIYFRTGKAQINVSSEWLSVSLYDVILYPEGAYHQEVLFPSAAQEIICIRVKINGGLGLDNPIQLKDQNQVFNWLFQKTHEEYKRMHGFGMAEDYARMILLTCMQQNYLGQSGEKDHLDVVMQYIDDHFYEEISINQLAEIAHVSDAYLSRCFKRRHGTSIIKYVNMLRVEAAKHMLISTGDSINEISSTVGFQSPKYFSRVFKNYVDMSPTEFRELNTSDNRSPVNNCLKINDEADPQSGRV